MEKQLDLFEGVILTQEQEQMIKDFIANKEKNVTRAFEENRLVQSMLVDAGFIQGEDFKNTFETVVIEADEVQLGSSWRDNEFTAKNITYVNPKGGITLLSKIYDKESDKVVNRNISYFSREGDKFECSSLTGNYRKIKPTTMLTKLQEQRESVEYEMKANRERNNAFNIALIDLKTKFPSTDIFIIDDYSGYGRNYRTYKRIKAQFENGSYVTFSVNADGGYKVDKKYDANFAAMDSNEVMEFFTNQNK